MTKFRVRRTKGLSQSPMSCTTWSEDGVSSEVVPRDASGVVPASDCHLAMAYAMADQQIPQAHAAADSIQSAVESTNALVLRRQ